MIQEKELGIFSMFILHLGIDIYTHITYSLQGNIYNLGNYTNPYIYSPS